MSAMGERQVTDGNGRDTLGPEGRRCSGCGKLISSAIVPTNRGRSVAKSFSGMGLDGYASGVVGRDSWFLSPYSWLNLPDKKPLTLTGRGSMTE
jgi:hypothetical protein